eukprot:scaffold17465_cov18-Tisochrysis_lutea.AAC.1
MQNRYATMHANYRLSCPVYSSMAHGTCIGRGHICCKHASRASMEARKGHGHIKAGSMAHAKGTPSGVGLQVESRSRRKCCRCTQPVVNAMFIKSKQVISAACHKRHKHACRGTSLLATQQNTTMPLCCSIFKPTVLGNLFNFTATLLVTLHAVLGLI